MDARTTDKTELERALAGGMVRTLAGRHLLFSEPAQAIYELDEGTAERLRIVPRDDAPATLVTSSRTLPDAVADADGLTVEISGGIVQLRVPDFLLPEVRALFGHLATEARTVSGVIDVRSDGAGFEIRRTGQAPDHCERNELVPLLKAELIAAALECADYEVALHTAALVRGDEMLLLAGSPGAGKTTLAAALTRAGYALAADDVVLMHQDGLGTGLLLPFGLKEGAWPLIADLWPNDRLGPIHSRPDRQLVRYLVPEATAAPKPRRIGSVIILDRRGEGRAALEEIEPIVALDALLSEGFTRDERLSRRGFDALIRALDGARCRRLIYANLREGADLLADL